MLKAESRPEAAVADGAAAVAEVWSVRGANPKTLCCVAPVVDVGGAAPLPSPELDMILSVFFFLGCY